MIINNTKCDIYVVEKVYMNYIGLDWFSSLRNRYLINFSNWTLKIKIQLNSNLDLVLLVSCIDDSVSNVIDEESGKKKCVLVSVQTTCSIDENTKEF